jgi:lysophospholipase L1-like esterase
MSNRRVASVVRVVTAVISLGFILFALRDHPVLQAGEVFGWFQITLLAVGIGVGALCFAPLTWNERLLTILISVCLTLVVAEFALRIALGPQFYGIYQRDDRVLYRLIPGVERDTTLPAINGGIRIRYKINSQGFRGKELAAPGESTRVVVYGDSFIQGDFSRTEDTFTERLKEHLAQQTGKPIEVVNAGVAGYGPDQELRRMEDELPVLKPNLVIVAIYAGNDFGDLLRDKLYRLSSDGSLQDNPSEVLDDAIIRDMVRSRSESILRKMVRSARLRIFGDPSQIFVTGREARLGRVEADLKQGFDEYRQYVIEGDNAVHDLYVDPYNADVSLKPTSESARYKIAMMEQIIVRMGQTAARQHVPLMFLLIPTPIDVADMHESGEVDPARYPEYKRSNLTDTLEQICARHQLPVVNLFGPFWERGARDLYLKSWDDHWNPKGQEFAAEIVSSFVTANNLLRIQPAIAGKDSQGR